MGKRLNLSNIDSRLIDRLQNESRREHLSFNQIISEAIDFYFHQKDIERIKEDPPEPLEINLETPENKQLLKELREQKEEKQKKEDTESGKMEGLIQQEEVKNSQEKVIIYTIYAR